MRKYFIRKETTTHNYYRSGISTQDIRRTMLGRGFMSVTQIAGYISHIIPPEVKVRHESNKRYGDGTRRVIRLRLFNLTHHGYVKKQGVGRDAKYCWVEKEDTASK